MYSVKNHRLHFNEEQVDYHLTPNRTQSFVLKPEGIVVHDTAGRLDGATSVNWFLKPEARSSAHLVVHRDGQVTQLAPFNVKTWHAGKSSHRGRTGVNNFALGIEIVNPGKLDPLGNGLYQSWFKETYRDTDFTIIEKSTPEHGTGGWMDYTGEQIATLEKICTTLFDKYSIDWICPHWQVSPGRKIDTNPLFPLQHLQSLLYGRKDDDGSTGMMLANTNHRRWPSYADNIIQVIPINEKVDIIRSGEFQNGDESAMWHLVSYQGHEGWVHGSLMDL